MNEISNSLGERVRKMRKACKWTQRDLAEKLDLSHVQISRLEAGERNWSVENAEKAAEAFGVPLALLQDPSIPLERLESAARILDGIRDLPEEQLEAILQLLDSLQRSPR